ncbi:MULTISPECIES: glycosyltransferase [unclassified Enterococcus]|uniref:glycosyltransferase n=1 Tax=unclassified Enterococcus TaxID=2608891 RepID=UPI001CE10E51|nr:MULTISPECIES: glycosyltransferase [unclassified Enterococcus]MCA5014453.1 glycosyltransferase [Enterococcus sp. S23]MCA5017433.1 glycosyltransferase [Enterococcus sp. S22(2020)]
MKILFLVSSFPALSETFILNQITGLIDEGYDVEIVSTKKVTPPYHPDVERYQLMDKVTYIDVPANKIKKLRLVAKESARIGVRKTADLLNKKVYGTFVYSFRPLLFQSYITKNVMNWEAIICHYGSNALLVEIIKVANPEIDFPPILSFFHGNDITGFTKRFGEEIYAPLHQANQHFLPISENWKKRLLELGFPKDKIDVHHMGVDRTKFAKVELSDFTQPIRLLIVGRLTEKKGIDDAILAVKQLKESGHAIQLNIIGDGELHTMLKQLINELDIVDHVKLMGWQDQDTVKAFMEQADIILLPSKQAENGDMEGIPVSLMEALATGKLVVSTYHSGIPELIKDDYNGWLIPENSPEQLAEKIADILKMSYKERLEISKNAVKSIHDHFDIHQLNKQLSQKIKQVK